MEFKIVLFVSFLFISKSEQNYSLKQVLILSRHNIRTPLAQNLAELTPNPWPAWKEKSGYLTEKGAILEGYMGKFISSWLHAEGLLPSHCPNREDIYIYANTKQRTKASAQAFVDKAFPGCNVTIHHNDSDKMDPIFNPVIHNTSEIFKEIALKEIKQRLRSLHLDSSYKEMESILDYKDSELCKSSKKCDLVTDTNKIINVVAGSKPNVVGPLKIGNSAIDSFVMEYYNGFPLNKVAWGKLHNTTTWDNIMRLSRGYHNVIFNTSLVAKDISEPLIKYMAKTFLNNDTTPKFTLLMGHDANMYTLLNGMDFKPYSLPRQYEITPVGGKIVFQRWHDENNDKYVLKIDFIYQTTKQMREGEELSLRNPARFETLELKGCETDDKGFCPWDDFVKLLNTLI